MKKTYISAESGERCALYTDISAVYGGYILETGGDPTCLNELEQAGDETTIDAVRAIIADSSTPWEICNEADCAYISECLETWGISAAQN